MIIHVIATTLEGLADVLIAALDAGSGAAYARFYTGTMPATPATAITTQTLLGTMTCSDPCATRAGGVITFDAITQDSAADASGTATWARLFDSAGNAKIDLDVTDDAGTGAIKLNTTTIVAGGPIQLNSLVITIG